MEHIVQFAIGIDDDAIRKVVLETAERKIIENITFDVKSQIFRPHHYKKNVLTDELQPWVDRKIDGIIDSCKDEIIEKAAIMLADRLSRTKKAKEALNDVVENL